MVYGILKTKLSYYYKIKRFLIKIMYLRACGKNQQSDETNASFPRRRESEGGHPDGGLR